MIGIIADVQYCNQDDSPSFDGRLRHYRNALAELERAVTLWNSKPVSAIVQLGDLLDIGCSTLGQSDTDLNRVKEELDKCKCKTISHVVGNHEMCNFSRDELSSRLNIKTPAWHSFVVSNMDQKVRIVILDSYDISSIGGTTQENTKLANKILSIKNPNQIHQFGVDWAAGLSGLDLRWMPYNGAFSDDQLKWLDETLSASDEKCLLFSHVPLLPRAADPRTLLWNYDDVLQILHKYPNVTMACISGHDHAGGYSIDNVGIHHITLPSPLEDFEDAFGCIKLFEDRLEIDGYPGMKFESMRF